MIKIFKRKGYKSPEERSRQLASDVEVTRFVGGKPTTFTKPWPRRKPRESKMLKEREKAVVNS